MGIYALPHSADRNYTTAMFIQIAMMLNTPTDQHIQPGGALRWPTCNI